MQKQDVFTLDVVLRDVHFLQLGDSSFLLTIRSETISHGTMGVLTVEQSHEKEFCALRRRASYAVLDRALHLQLGLLRLLRSSNNLYDVGLVNSRHLPPDILPTAGRPHF